MSAAVSPVPARVGARPVDTHAHWYPQEFIALLDRKAAANGGRMERDEKGVPVFSLPGVQPVSRMPPLMVEPELILKEMDQRGIETYVLSLTNPMVYWAPPAFGLELAQTWNDISSAVCVKHPGRFVGTIQLPMQAPEMAVRELERAARLAGLRAVYMATHVNGRNLDDKAFWPVYERCEGFGLPVFLHPLYPCGGDRIAKHFMRNLCGNPYENGLAAASLVLGGVMDAFPGLVVMLPQAGGVFPWLIGRFDRGVEVRKELAHMTQPPSAYLRRFYYDTVSHHPLIMKFLTELVGADRVVLGSDYNQDMGCERPVEFVEKIPGLTERERNLILRENAARLLRL
jgi:aminocarboxymuconate-semialdehyde decarboxylase